MEILKHQWAPILVLVAIFCMRFARYLQWKWTKENTDPAFQLQWLLGIYAHGFVFVALGMWLGLNLTAGPLAMNYPKDVDSISTPAKVLEILQENIKVSARHSEVLGWFIFFSMLWVSNLLTSLPGVWKRLLP